MTTHLFLFEAYGNVKKKKSIKERNEKSLKVKNTIVEFSMILP